MKARTVRLAVGLAIAIALVGCGKAEPTSAPVAAASEGGEAGSPRGGELQGSNALALGTLKLEGTEHAVTPEQAAAMLPLWKVIQGGSLQGAAETDAVLKQIEGTLDEGQLAAIEGMELSFQEIGAWMESPSAQALGIETPAFPGGQGAGRSDGGAFGNMTEEQRTQFRQEFQNMTPEQRATRAAEMGFQVPEGGVPGGGGQGGRPGGGQGGGTGGTGGRPGGFAARGGGNVLLDPLIELLSARATE